MAAVHHPFTTLPGTAASHFRLHFYAAVAQVLAVAGQRAAAWDALRDRVQALAAYEEELRAGGVPPLSAADAPGWWWQAIAAWEADIEGFLPIRAIRESMGADHHAMALVFAAGLIEEDPRFAALFELLNEVPGQHRPSAGVLAACWRDAGAADAVRARLRALEQHGLLRSANVDAPRLHRAFEVPGAVWDALRGERHDHPAPWLRYRDPSTLLAWSELIVPGPLREALGQVPALLESGEARTVIVRGPRHNGRRALLGAIARALGRGVLEVDEAGRRDDDRERQVALLATALHAVPITACEPAPGERIEIPWAAAFEGPIGVAIGRSGGIGGAATERALMFALETPGPAARREHWVRALSTPNAQQDRKIRFPTNGKPPLPTTDVDAVVERFRLTAGHIHRVAALARAQARLAGRHAIGVADVQGATRLLNAQALDALAVRVPAAGTWADLAARDDTLRDLMDLELRCRHRERLPAPPGTVAGPSTHCGVRALFRGPSGTGKTLAARVLSAVLQKDLYRVDLASIVNKYIGETEKNLERVISRAEELDIILLFDEGDALLTHRTDVSNATDRYANLETNFLLQRLESFDGILIVTTNAGDRIDAAFERRMDVVVEFQPPQAAERWELWQLHLPRSHVADPEFLNEVATRCVLSGGQIRNAVLHASLLAVHGAGVIDAAMLEAGVRREYRKAGAVCPLRPSFAVTEV